LLALKEAEALDDFSVILSSLLIEISFDCSDSLSVVKKKQQIEKPRQKTQSLNSKPAPLKHHKNHKTNP
jgi:hypothetical protein